MNRSATRLLAALLLLSLGCDQNRTRQQAIRDDPDKSFSDFASVLYDQLEAEPLGSIDSVDVGLFGDLTVTSGESISMGRFRFLTESAGTEPQARMIFLVREMNTRGDPIPVHLRFVAREGLWQLEEAVHGAEAPPTTPFQDALAQDFDAWVSAAVERAQEDRASE